MTADADGDRLAVDFEARVIADLLLHLRGGIQRRVGIRKRRHDLIAHGLDDRALAPFSGAAHHVDADRHHVARPQIPHDVVQPRRPHDVREQDSELYVFAHACG